MNSIGEFQVSVDRSLNLSTVSLELAPLKLQKAVVIGRAKDQIRKQAKKYLQGNVPSTTPIDTHQNKQLVESRSKDLLKIQVEDTY